jgi:hypothetical protein
MREHLDIEARTQSFRDAVRAFTAPPPKRYAKLMPLKDGIVDLREKGASLRLVRELVATVTYRWASTRSRVFLAR